MIVSFDTSGTALILQWKKRKNVVPSEKSPFGRDPRGQGACNSKNKIGVSESLALNPYLESIFIFKLPSLEPEVLKKTRQLTTI